MGCPDGSGGGGCRDPHLPPSLSPLPPSTTEVGFIISDSSLHISRAGTAGFIHGGIEVDEVEDWSDMAGGGE